jgi:predicted LPLAT superfamily acyltransferase
VSAVWHAEPERGSETLMRLVTWLALRLGRRATRWLLYPMALYYLAFAPRARRASRAFLERALGRRAGAADVLRNFHAYASTLHDRVYLLCGRFEDLDISISGAPQLDAILAQGRGCILLGSHLGSFEALRAVGRQVRRWPINIVMYEGADRRVSGVLNGLAPELKASVIAPGRPETMLRIKECLERGEIVGILGDRPFGSEKTSACPFLGAPARSVSPGAGAGRAGRAVLRPVPRREPLRGLPRGAGRAAVGGRGGPRGARRSRWVERYVRRLEHYARAAPYNWFNFYDFWHEGLR